MRYIALMLAGLLAGCGNGDSSTRVVAAFITTPLAARLAAKDAKPVVTPTATLAATRAPAPPPAPASDAFHAQVRAVVATAADGTEPADVDAVPASAPEDSEPVPL